MFEDTKEVIRSRDSKEQRQFNGLTKMNKIQKRHTMVDLTIHRKPNTEKH
jgi:hypothetical protein